MNPTKRFSLQVSAACCAAALALTGCASNPKQGEKADGKVEPASITIPGVNRSMNAVNGLKTLNDDLSKEKVQVEKTLQALHDTLQGQGDLIPAMKQFTADVADTRLARQQTDKQTESMRGAVRDYITNWEVEVYGVDNQQLRSQAQSRRDQVRQNFVAINDRLKEATDAYGKYVNELDDLQRVLSNDLTRQGVAAAQGGSQKVVQTGETFRQKLDTTMAELNRVSGEMTPAGPASGGTSGRTVPAER